VARIFMRVNTEAGRPEFVTVLYPDEPDAAEEISRNWRQAEEKVEEYYRDVLGRNVRVSTRATSGRGSSRGGGSVWAQQFAASMPR